MSIRFSRKPMPAGAADNPLAQPEIYYRLQPDIVQACDELESKGVRIPTSEQVEQMTERIYDNVSRRYPDLAKQAQEYENSRAAASSEPVVMFGITIQQRGTFRRLIAFLLLSEFFRRRHRRRRH